mmetsp:Transcript_32509/g.43367  ORF Transcript_32509/g.43367 Transcript_32509/m.43367 type:complete len:227 (+) Transcript_32509:696-1376(+)
MARAKHINCLCPTLKFDPPSATIESSPSGISSISCIIWTSDKAFLMACSSYSQKGSRFSLTVHPLNKTGVCGITDMPPRTMCSPNFDISTSPTSILPLSASKMRKRACTNELFPDPVLPTTPTLWPLSISNVISERAEGRDALYRTVKLLTLIDAFAGHDFALSSYFTVRSASGGNFPNADIRSTDTIWFTTSALCLTIQGKLVPASCNNMVNERPRTAGSTPNHP